MVSDSPGPRPALPDGHVQAPERGAWLSPARKPGSPLCLLGEELQGLPTPSLGHCLSKQMPAALDPTYLG